MDTVPEAIVQRCTELSSNPGNEFFTQWEELKCRSSMYSVISTQSGTLEYSEVAQQSVEASMTTILNSYSSVYEFTPDTTSPLYSNFQYELLSTCIDPGLPGICDTFLTSYCSNYSRSDITGNSFLTSLCGCYVPPDSTYLQYTTGNEACLDGLPGCQVCDGDDCYGQPACDPLCHRTLTVQKANKSIGRLITCSENVCVQDESNAAVTADESVSFLSVCTGCSTSGGCICIVNTPSDLETNVYSLCGPDSVYLVNGVPTDEPPIYTPDPINVTWGLVLILIIVLIALIVFVLIKNGKRAK